MNSHLIYERRAVEALRAGVPNRDVVRQLPPVDTEVDKRFQSLLKNTIEGWEQSNQASGILVAGDFGTGKSHYLESFRHQALEEHFICSSIVLNKETPLYDPLKIYRACVESATAPDKLGTALDELTLTYSSQTAPHYRELFEWVHVNKDLDPRIAATLSLFERVQNEDLRQKIIAEWMGYPMKVGEIKAALRDIGEAKTYQITRSQPGQVLQRFEFLSRFFRSAGYSGWVLLIDETEMISKYSLLQRAKAYAQLAKLLGIVKGTNLPGIASVFTITNDYAGQVLHGRKNDRTNIPARLQGTKNEEFSVAADMGMKTIETRTAKLSPPTQSQMLDVYQKVRRIYSSAYSWEAPEIEDRREYSASTGMRQYIRSWINTWDLRRLYNYTAENIVEDLPMRYEEDTDFQAEHPVDDDEPMITF